MMHVSPDAAGRRASTPRWMAHVSPGSFRATGRFRLSKFTRLIQRRSQRGIPGAFVGEESAGRRQKNLVHVEVGNAAGLKTAKAVVLDVYYSIQRPVVVASRGAAAQRVARAGEHFVAAELNRRGAYAVTFAGNMPNIDILASDADQNRTVMIQVKTRRKGTWHSSSTRGIPRTKKDADNKFWVFVDLPDAPGQPSYFIAPEWWVLNDIYVHHGAYLAKHGGKRAVNPDSTHHAIKHARIEEWRNRWDILGLF